jgi:hypothetical protein
MLRQSIILELRSLPAELRLALPTLPLLRIRSATISFGSKNTSGSPCSPILDSYAPRICSPVAFNQRMPAEYRQRRSKRDTCRPAAEIGHGDGDGVQLSGHDESRLVLNSGSPPGVHYLRRQRGARQLATGLPQLPWGCWFPDHRWPRHPARAIDRNPAAE